MEALPLAWTPIWSSDGAHFAPEAPGGEAVARPPQGEFNQQGRVSFQLQAVKTE